jgi:hypothetical protein
VPPGVPLDLGRVAALQQLDEAGVLARRLGGTLRQVREHGRADPVQPVVRLLQEVKQPGVAAPGDDRLV